MRARSSFTREVLGMSRALPAVPAAGRRLLTGVPYVPRGAQVTVLVNGYGASDWRHAKRTLEGAGHTVDVFAYLVSSGTFATFTDALARRVVELAAGSGESVALVGHSYGGILARAVVQQRPAGRCVASCVAVASPHHGTPVARYDPFTRAARSMRPGSLDLAALNAAPVPDGVRFHHVVAGSDGIVPPASQRPPIVGSRGLLIADAHHIDVLRHPRFLAALPAMVAREDAPGRLHAPPLGSAALLDPPAV